MVLLKAPEYSGVYMAMCRIGMGGYDLKLRASAWPRAEGFVLKGGSPA